jgi:hypothetical protein
MRIRRPKTALVEKLDSRLSISFVDSFSREYADFSNNSARDGGAE